MLLNRAAPAELVAIIGKAITFTSARASSKGLETAKMIPIWTASAKTVVRNTTFGS